MNAAWEADEQLEGSLVSHSVCPTAGTARG